MSTEAIAAAMQRVQSVMLRRPEMAVHADAPALANWDGGLRVVTQHPAGHQVVTDMPAELGGSGEQVTPGWLLRAALASCAVTRIAMAAAAEGITLSMLGARATSRSDVRGLLGMPDERGAPVAAGPDDVELHVTIAAAGVPAQRLRALVEGSCLSSPVGCAMASPVPVALRIDLG